MRGWLSTLRISPPASRRGRNGSCADVEVDFRPGAAADPVALQGFDAFGPIEGFQIFFEAIGVRGDAEHPLPQRHADDGVVAAFALAVDDFFVGEHRAQGRAPVDRGFGLVGEAMFVLVRADGVVALRLYVGRDWQFADRSAALLVVVEPRVVDLEKDPLRPADVFDIGRRQLAASNRTRSRAI